MTKTEDMPPEPPAGTWVRDRHGATTLRQGAGWAPPGFFPLVKWEKLWKARGPLVVCEPWGLESREPTEQDADYGGRDEVDEAGYWPGDEFLPGAEVTCVGILPGGALCADPTGFIVHNLPTCAGCVGAVVKAFLRGDDALADVVVRPIGSGECRHEVPLDLWCEVCLGDPVWADVDPTFCSDLREVLDAMRANRAFFNALPSEARFAMGRLGALASYSNMEAGFRLGVAAENRRHEGCDCGACLDFIAEMTAELPGATIEDD